ncbi:MAG: ABC transporter substrate-binding protein [Gordonia sp. (in: high G+C Gram-positive bacteria)]|uniref:ABC transporter substrate-binding protein n=1 Tax=Gordonia sp. (in: high G+C Gram-positive bacteria) TaxID=84139 RepID=UPI0039E70284
MSARGPVWFTRCPVPTAFSIAVATGGLPQRLADLGVDFQSLATSRDASTRTAHFTQAQPRSTRHGGNIPPIVATSRGARLAIVGLSVAPSRAALLTLPSSGIASPQDLRGKTIGVPKRVNDPVDFWRASVLQGAQRAVQAAGLGPDDVTFRDIIVDRTFVAESTRATGSTSTLWDAGFMLGFQRAEIEALFRGEVDAIFSEGSNRVVTQAITGAVPVVEVGESSHTDPALSSNLRPLTLTVSRDLLEDDPDVVAAIVEETSAAARWAGDNAAGSARILAAEAGIPEELVIPSFSPTLTSELDIDLTPARLNLLDSQIRFLHDNGFLDGPVDVADLVEPTALTV